MKQEIRQLIEQYAHDNQINNTQSLRFLICNIKQVCEELGLDFDIALDKSEIFLPQDACEHINGHPTRNAFFCPDCNAYVWIKENHWR